MKYIFFMLLIFMGILPACAEYKPIPPELSKQYKAEMEQIINEEYSKVHKRVDDIVKEAKESYKKLMKEGYSDDIYYPFSLAPNTALPASDLEMYVRMSKITSEKYLNKKYEPYEADISFHEETFLNPYFEQCRVDTKKIKQLNKYINKKIHLVKKYVKKVQNYYNLVY